jgi:hypothetical protein
MPWTTPQFTREEINRAANQILNPLPSPVPRTLADGSTDPASHKDLVAWVDGIETKFKVINNWRASHSFPLNTFKIGLLRNAEQVDKNCLVAQRLKRLSSIFAKLRRFHDMKLSQMQDIAGCRAVVNSVKEAYQLVDLYKHSEIKHKLLSIDDYIGSPKASGYRSVHLIYGYYSDRKTTYNGLKVEVQLRSTLQHAWATAVETVGTFIRQALKSSQGEEDWLRFFVLMGSAIATRENTPPVPGTPGAQELKANLREFAEKLDVEGHLKSYAEALKTPVTVGLKGAHYFLLNLDPATKEVNITGYKSAELEKASNDYLEVEREIIEGKTGKDAVLVSVDSLEALKKAYPNYFLDTHRFIEAVKQATS